MTSQGRTVNGQKADSLAAQHRAILVDDVIPFWVTKSVDRVHGGFITGLDRDGSVIDSDKSVWAQARMTWLFARLYNRVEPRSEWFELAAHGYRFLTAHCIAPSERPYFLVTRDGRPLRTRRYWFTEAFLCIAFSEFARAAELDRSVTGSGAPDPSVLARRYYHMIADFYDHPEKLPSKVDARTRPAISHANPMILLATTQVLRENGHLLSDRGHRYVDDLIGRFVSRSRKALLESVAPDGSMLPGPAGRCVNPGHAIETAWFLMHEASLNNDRQLLDTALQVLRWSLDLGWDTEEGGLLSFVDLDGRPPVQLEWDMKLWWPHTEALYALLLAHRLTSDSKYETWFDTVQAWSYAHFPDPVYGEWYGYLHRDGSVASQAKGGLWKSAFHLSRYLINAVLLLSSRPESL